MPDVTEDNLITESASVSHHGGRPVTAETDWATTAIGYQVYVRSFADSNGDGMGDLRGVTEHLGYLELLGIDVIWLNPFYVSPMADAGYDVADPRDVDPMFGTLAEFDELVTAAHRAGIRIVIDLVPNHSSDQHVWFQQGLDAGPGSPERERYIFRDGRGDDGDQPPNNWNSIFGGPAWTRVADGQWYLHIFAPEQPDLNWDNPEVQADLAETLRFWIDRGVDGFRIDVAHGMAKPEGLPDAAPGSDALGATGIIVPDNLSETADEGGTVVPIGGIDDPRFDNDGVHEIHRMIRRVLDEYPGVVSLGEVWVADPERWSRYIRNDELHQAFDFSLVESPYTATDLQAAITKGLAASASVGKVPVWTLSNHDVPRPVTRYGDGPIGVERARALLLVELALPGSVFIYNGEELGLPNAHVPDDKLQDPTWKRSGHTERGRDGCRIPLPWEGEEPPFAFSTNADTWLPMPADYAEYTVERQLDDPDSTLNLLRRAIELRAEHPAFSGHEISWYGAPADCLAFRRDGGGLVCALNAGDSPIDLPPGEVLLASAPLVDGRLAANSAVWLTPN